MNCFQYFLRRTSCITYLVPTHTLRELLFLNGQQWSLGQFHAESNNSTEVLVSLAWLEFSIRQVVQYFMSSEYIF